MKLVTRTVVDDGHRVKTALTRRAVVLVILVVALTLGGSAAAFAFWKASGSGSGTASSGTVLNVSLTAATPLGGLSPGGQTSVALSASNPNTTVVQLRSLALDTSQGTGGFAVDGGHPACGIGALSFGTQNNAGAGWSVPARSGAVNGTLVISLPNALSMAGSAANGCQGATFTVYLVAGP